MPYFFGEPSAASYDPTEGTTLYYGDRDVQYFSEYLGSPLAGEHEGNTLISQEVVTTHYNDDWSTSVEYEVQPFYEINPSDPNSAFYFEKFLEQHAFDNFIWGGPIGGGDSGLGAAFTGTVTVGEIKVPTDDE